MKNEIMQIKLKNGLKVSLSPIKSAKSICVYVAIAAGPKYEDNKTSGLAHFLEHMLFEGTENYPSPRSLSEYIENVGGLSGAWTDKEFVIYYVKVPAGELEVALTYLSQIFFKSLLNDENIEKEKRIISEELKKTTDNPESNIWESGMKEAWGSNSYLSRSTLGEASDILQVDRLKLKNYLEKLYFPGNMRMTIVGNFSIGSAKNLFSHLFSSIKIQNSPKGEKAIFKKKKHHVKIVKTYSSQTQIILGFTTQVGVNHKDFYKMKLIGDILGLGVSSRLFHGLIYDLGIAYSVGSGFLPYKDCGILYVVGGFSSENLELAVKFILSEFKKMKMGEISSAELQNVKRRTQASINFSLETLDGVARLYAEQMITEDRITPPEEIIRKISEISPEDILKASNKHLGLHNLSLVINGNIETNTEKNMEELIQKSGL